MHRSASATDGDTAQLPDPGSNPTLAYCTVQPDRWTFGADKIRAWVEQYLEGHVLNACAGQTVLDHEPVHRNDIDTDIDADTHHDVRALPDKLDTQFDVVVYDPPFTVNQAAETYDEEAPGYGPDIVDALHSLLRPGGRVVMFGYSTWGMPADRGYRREAVGLFNTLGRQHDYLGVVSRHDPDGEIPGAAHQPATVRANAVAPTDHEYEDQPEATVEMSHHECDDSGWLEADTIRTWVEEHLDGKALVVHDRPGVDQLDHSPLRVNSPPDSEWDGTNADMTIAPTALSDRLSQVFETAVFAPATTAFQATTDHRGHQTGLSTAIKREIHEVLEPGGTVIQLGHTASCMRADFGYKRETIAICARPGSDHDIIGTVDRKCTNDLTDFARQSGSTYKQCDACFDEWTTLDPVFQVPCPLCGATAAHKVGTHLQGGEYCLNPDGTVPNAGTPLEGIHWDRVQAARERLDSFEACPATDTGIHDRRVNQPVQFEPILFSGSRGSRSH